MINSYARPDDAAVATAGARAGADVVRSMYGRRLDRIDKGAGGGSAVFRLRPDSWPRLSVDLLGDTPVRTAPRAPRVRNRARARLGAVLDVVGGAHL
ncbi:hypothetical protein [Streptomyces sp. NPDC004976]